MKRLRFPCPDCGALVAVAKGVRRVECAHCLASLSFEECGLRGKSALVAVRCNGCGATTSYPEASSTHRCAYCGAAYFVAAAQRVARYYVPSKIDLQQARKQAARAIRGRAAVKSAERFFVPYWRVSGAAFLWQQGKFELASKAFDRSIPAGNFDIGEDSLGARLTRVDRVPFSRTEASKQGKLLAPTLSAAEAEGLLHRRVCHALRDHSIREEREHGNVIGERTALIWYPYWVMQAGGRRIVVDGVSGGLIVGVPQKIRHRKSACGGVIPSLVDAVCPSCRSEFKFEGFERIFFCAGCRRAWLLDGNSLIRQKYLVPKGMGTKSGSFLPLWRLGVALDTGRREFRDQEEFREFVPRWDYQANAPSGAGKPFFLYVPAWGNRRQPRISVISRRWTRQQPRLIFGEKPKFGRIFRPIYGKTEAMELALLTLLGVIHRGHLQTQALLRGRLRVERTELLLVPCKQGTHEWIDTVTETAVPYNELSERKIRR